MDKAECLFTKLAQTYKPSAAIRFYDVIRKAWKGTKDLKKNVKGAFELRRQIEKGEAGIEPFKTLVESGVYANLGKKYIKDISKGVIIPATAGGTVFAGAVAYQGAKSLNKRLGLE